MLSQTDHEICDLPVDALGLLVLDDYNRTSGWSAYNYVNQARNDRRSAPVLRALSEALSWLIAHGLLAMDLQQNSGHAAFITRAGRRVLEDGPTAFYAVQRLQDGLHPLIETVARSQFLLGQYELAVFASMKAVEVRTRTLARLGDDVFGVDVFNQAFGKAGVLTDQEAVSGERDGTRSLFAGAYAVFRNPAGHREVDYTEVAEAAEAVQCASLLMRILDRVEAARVTNPER